MEAVLLPLFLFSEMFLLSCIFILSLALLMRLARARPYFFLPAKKVSKNASSSAVLDTYRLDV
jgi:hypothetical protein